MLTDSTVAFPAENAVSFLERFGVKYLNSVEIDPVGISRLTFKIDVKEQLTLEFLWDALVRVSSKFYRGTPPIDSGVMKIDEASKLFTEIMDYYKYESD